MLNVFYNNQYILYERLINRELQEFIASFVSDPIG